MRRNEPNKKYEGSITVFLSLILLLILSLLFTLIEGARISTAKVYAERAFTTAMDSVLAEYYGPLWKEYHMFGLDTEDDTDEAWQDNLSTKLQEYMSYTFEPGQGLKHNAERIELYDISVDTLSVKDPTMLTDYQGELFINQAIEYMKYKELGDTMELLLEKMSLLEPPKKVSVLYEEKQKVEEELVEIDEGILELMKLLDGVRTGKKGIEVTKDGKLKTVNKFVKKICFGTVTKEAVGINQESVFLALKDSYVNPIYDFKALDDNFIQLEEIMQQMVDIIKEESETLSSIATAKATLKELNSMDNKTVDVKAQIKELKAMIKEMEGKREELQEDKETYEASKKLVIKDINQLINDLSLLMKEIIPTINDAMDVIDRIMAKLEIAGPLISGYEERLYNSKSDISDEVFIGMKEDLTKLKRYTQMNIQGYDFLGMKQTLEHDLTVLSQVEGLLGQAAQEFVLEKYQASRMHFANAGNILLTYQTNNLRIDYSTIVLDKKEKLNPLGMAGSLIEDGIIGLVIDPAMLSEAELTEEVLPSVIAAMASEDGGFLGKLTTFMENAVIGDKKSGMGSLFGAFGEDAGVMEAVGEGINIVAEHFLFQEYMQEHFYSFPKKEEDLSTRKPSVLTYEQEYLLVGKTVDKENLSSVISRIIFLRTILDFVSILGDRDKCNEAQLAATALVGFTGLPILISITKTLILLVWSFAEALVDTSAMLMDKEIPILKKDLIVTFPELLLLNRNMIQSKASKITEANKLSLSYHDYLRIFLLIKSKKDLTYRSMDLIQENIQIRYLDDFSIQDCLFGFKANVSFIVASKFTTFSFVQKQIGRSPKGFKFGVRTAYSY